jgi:DMSO/TMAO reductase YedYZ heme-binding membrane subunit
MKSNKSNLAIIVSILAYVALEAALIFWYGFSYKGVDITLRVSSKVSLVLFFFIFIASPLNNLAPSEFSLQLLEYRRQLAIIFGITFLQSHFSLICLQFFIDSPRIWNQISLSDIFIGGAGVLLLVLLLVTSFEKYALQLKPRSWKVLHKTGLYFIWLVFALDQIEKYFLLTPRGQPEYYVPFLVLLFGALGLRIVSCFVKPEKASLQVSS